MDTGPEKHSRLDATLARFGRLHPKLIDLSLGRIERLLAALDHPEWHLPPVIHIAGTNGKGSVIAFLRAILEAAGYRTHVYTSPHLVHFNERIRLAGQLIDDEALIGVLEEAEARNSEAPITYFEITTAAAFLAFARAPADVLLMETGLGGRLDATNVIDQPLLTAITPVTPDHQEFLGHDLGAIAGEKAGILKSGVRAVLAGQRPEADAAISARASAIGAELYRQGSDWSAAHGETGFKYHSPMRGLDLPPPSLAGAHQIDNAGLAVACLDCTDGFTVSDEHVRAGLATAVWPGRLQYLTQGPVPAALPAGWELWLDGGHNPGAGQALAQQAATWRDRPLYLIFGIMGNKDAKGFLEPLAPHLAGVVTVPVPGQAASLPTAKAADAARAAGVTTAAAADNVAAALAQICDGADTPARVLICGSLYLAGDVLSRNG